MAPLPEDNTKRFYYTYTNSLAEHTLVVRVPDDATTADADAMIGGILTAIGGSFMASTITDVSVSAHGSNTRFPIASDRIGDLFGSGAGSPEQNAVGIGFVGRSSGGRRTKFFLFGWGGGFGVNYRIDSSELVGVASIVNGLNLSTTTFLGIDGLPATWKGYANVKSNDHWVKKARS